MEVTIPATAQSVPPRVVADVDRVDLSRGKSAQVTLRFSPSVWEQELFLVIDVYSAANPVHPEGHAGWWKWPLTERENITLEIVKKGTKLSLQFNGQEPAELWVNDEFNATAEPVLALHVVLRRTLSSSICFNDLLQVFNDKQALAKIEARRQEFAALPDRPASTPWYVWPRDATVRIVAANIFERDAVGNYAIGLSRLLRVNGIPAELYAANFEPALRGTIRYIGDLLDAAQEQDLVWMNFSIYDPYMPAIANLDCRKLLYFHNITPPKYFQIYDAEYSMYCAKGLAQLGDADKFDVVLANSAVTADVIKQAFLTERAAASQRQQEAARRQPQSPAVAPQSAARRRTLGVPAALVAESKNGSAPKRAKKIKVAVSPPIIGHARWASIAAEPIELPKAKTLLLYVGRVAPHKRIEDLLAFYAKYHPLDRNSALLIVGGTTFAGYTGYLQYLLGHDYSSIRSKVHFLSGVSDGQLKTIYQSAAAFITMTEHEGYCVPLVEAMEIGLPVFAYADPAVAETLASAGRRFYQKEYSLLAADVHDTLTHSWKRESTIAAQRVRHAELAAAADGRSIWTALEKAMFARARPV